jgi:hypothetical protein
MRVNSTLASGKKDDGGNIDSPHTIEDPKKSYPLMTIGHALKQSQKRGSEDNTYNTKTSKQSARVKY